MENQAFEANMAIHVLPVLPDSQKKTEIVRIVDRVIDYIKSTGLHYYVGPAETAVEGDLDTLIDISKECQKICIREGAESVYTHIKFSYNPKKGVMTIDEKTTKHHQ